MAESDNMAESDSEDGLAAALFGVAMVRYAAFYDRFGRDPRPDEPLLFDPSKDEPTPASLRDRMLQVIAAAKATNTDPATVLHALGYGLIQ